jgi:hypothetical protein
VGVRRIFSLSVRIIAWSTLTVWAILAIAHAVGVALEDMEMSAATMASRSVFC